MLKIGDKVKSTWYLNKGEIGIIKKIEENYYDEEHKAATKKDRNGYIINWENKSNNTNHWGRNELILLKEKTKATVKIKKVLTKNKAIVKFVKTKYRYIRIIHQGQDYIKVKVGKNDYDITGEAISIIKTLINKINK